jgi:hypothetical protein
LMDAISTSPYGSSVRACLQRQPAHVEGCASRYKVPHFFGEAHDVAVSAPSLSRRRRLSSGQIGRLLTLHQAQRGQS